MFVKFFHFIINLWLLSKISADLHETEQPLKFLKLSSQINSEQEDKESENPVDFYLRLINVDSTSAQFEIIDDNRTATNYLITYRLKGNFYSMDHLKRPILEQSSLVDKLQMQTNVRDLIEAQKKEEQAEAEREALENKRKLNTTFTLNETTYDYEDDESTSGEKFTSEEISEFLNKSEIDLHKFTIDNLDENRFYEINLTITATEAHLKKKHELKHKLLKATRKLFEFKFKTTFDMQRAAREACQDSKQVENEEENSAAISLTASCYLKGSNCTKCKSNCYEVKQFARNVSKSEPVLCEACPCDSLRSTGDCVELEQSERQQQLIKCKQCARPYSGQFCNDCESDGVEFYKNELGECVKCECNRNSAFDNMDVMNAKKRRCQAITGICIDCMFNTTGKNCHECKRGFEGDALKRTCAPIKDSAKYIKPYSKLDKDRFTLKNDYKSFAVFLVYLFVLFIALLLTYVLIRRKLFKSDDKTTSLLDCFKKFPDSAKRTHFLSYLSSFCPQVIYRLKNSNRSFDSRNLNTTGSYDDDRLNLAEYQVFDEDISDETGKKYVFRAASLSEPISDSEDLQNNKNPYRNLSFKV